MSCKEVTATVCSNYTSSRKINYFYSIKNQKLLAKKKNFTTEDLKALVVDAILEKKGQAVVSLDLRSIHDTVADYFVVAHGDSATQVNAIFESILEMAKENGQQPYHHEGKKNGEWIIVDFVDVVAHIFHREKRDFYQLEELWSDAIVEEHDENGAIKTKLVRPVKTAAKKKTPATKSKRSVR
ncbi:MAG: ribosome silencing factor [Chitinophagales bacterium]